MIAAPTTGRALHAEWIKISTLRSTWLTALLAVAAALTFALLGYHNTAHRWPTWTASERAAYDPVRAGYGGSVDLAVLALGTLGVLAAAGEYGTGGIRATFTATPRRAHVVTAKILIVGGFSLALGQATAFTIFEAGQHLIASTGAQVRLSQPHVARAVLAAGLYLAASALIGLGLGFVIRRTAGALAAFFGLYFIGQLLLGGDLRHRLEGLPGGGVRQHLQRAAQGREDRAVGAGRVRDPGRLCPAQLWRRVRRGAATRRLTPVGRPGCAGLRAGLIRAARSGSRPPAAAAGTAAAPRPSGSGRRRRRAPG